MKHIFLPHSAITYLASLSIISEEALEEKDCLFIYQGSDLGFPKIIRSIYLNEQKIRSFGYVNRIDKLITSFTQGESYKLYICALNRLASILMTNGDCVSFGFFEDGTASYYKKYKTSFFQKEYPGFPKRINGFRDFYQHARLYWGSLMNLYPLPLYRFPLDYTQYVNIEDVVFYCTNQYTFPLAQNRKVMSVGGKYKKLLPHKYMLSNEKIWVSSGLFDFLPKEVDTITNIIKDYFSNLFSAEPFERIFIKYHQHESEKSKKAIKNVFSGFNLEVVEISDSTIMEIEILNAENVTMFGDITSLLLYNALWGGRSVSLIKKYAEKAQLGQNFYSKEILDTLEGVEFVD